VLFTSERSPIVVELNSVETGTTFVPEPEIVPVARHRGTEAPRHS